MRTYFKYAIGSLNKKTQFIKKTNLDDPKHISLGL